MLEKKYRRDPSWSLFARRLDIAMDDAGIGSTELALRVFGDAAEMPVVSRWRHGRQRPLLGQLPRIADALGLSPLDLPSAMGMIELPVDDPTSLARRVVELESHLVREVASTSVARSAILTAELWQAVTDSKTWTMSMYPAHEGLRGYEVLAATRLSFARLDERTAEFDDVEWDLGEQLRAVGAAPSGVPIYPPNPHAVGYSIREHTRPRPPHAKVSSHRARSFAVLATTVRSWVSDVAAHVAQPLGYGLTSPLDLAAAAAGKSISRTRPEERDQFASDLIVDQPHLYVAYHYEAIPTSRTRTHSAVRRAISQGQYVVWLDESDAMLDFAARNRTGANRPPYGEDLTRAIAFRNEMRQILAEIDSENVIILPIDLPDGYEPSASRPTLRSAAASHALEVAADLLATMFDRRWIAEGRMIDDDAPALRYLRAR